MADWITVTAKDSDGNSIPEPSDGLYGEDAVQVDFTYAANTTPSTRLAQLSFVNPIAEEKNEYNPESPDGRAEFYLYQFGERRLEIDLVSPSTSIPTATNCSTPHTLLTDQWNNSQYSQTHNVGIDFTTCLGDRSGVDNQPNAENRNRDYFTANDDAVGPFNLELTVISSSPWYIYTDAFWMGVPDSNFVNQPTYPGSNSDVWDTASPRTYNDSDTAVPVTVNIATSANQSTARTGLLRIINRQGYVQTINVSQKGYVIPNIPPVAVITGTSSGCPGETGSWDGSGSYDPDGSINFYQWGGLASGNNVTSTGTLPSNSSCTASNIQNATLFVRDDRNAQSGTRTHQVAVLPRFACELSGGANCPDDVMVPFNGTANLSGFSVTADPVSGCGTPATSIQSISPGIVNTFAGTAVVNRGNFNITTPGQSGTVTMQGQIGSGSFVNNVSCSTSVQFGEAMQAPTVTFSGDGNVTSPSGTVTATCTPNDPNNATPYAYAWSGGGFSGSNSTSTDTYSGLSDGASKSFSAQCCVTNDFGQQECTTASTSVTYSQPCTGGGSLSSNSSTNASPSQQVVTLNGSGFGTVCWNVTPTGTAYSGIITGPLPSGSTPILRNGGENSGSGCQTVALSAGQYIISSGATTNGSGVAAATTAIGCSSPAASVPSLPAPSFNCGGFESSFTVTPTNTSKITAGADNSPTPCLGGAPRAGWCDQLTPSAGGDYLAATKLGCSTYQSQICGGIIGGFTGSFNATFTTTDGASSVTCNNITGNYNVRIGGAWRIQNADCSGSLSGTLCAT